MLIMVIYDISNNHSRGTLIKTLQHFGLHRIQKSAFLGNLNSSKRGELEEELKNHLSEDKDSIYLVPICDQCKKLTKIYSFEERTLENSSNFRIL